MTENEDYISGLKMARKIADNITSTVRTMLNNDKITVFPYRYTILLSLSYDVKIEYFVCQITKYCWNFGISNTNISGLHGYVAVIQKS